MQALRDVEDPGNDFATWVIAIVGGAIGAVLFGWSAGVIAAGCAIPTFIYQLGAVWGESEYAREKARKSRWAKFERGLGLFFKVFFSAGAPAFAVFIVLMVVWALLRMLGDVNRWSLWLFSR